MPDSSSNILHHKFFMVQYFQSFLGELDAHLGFLLNLIYVAQGRKRNNISQQIKKVFQQNPEILNK